MAFGPGVPNSFWYWLLSHSRYVACSIERLSGLAVDYRDIDHMTAAAHAGRLDVLVEVRLDARPVLHRLRRDDVIHEGAADLVGRSRVEGSGDRILKKIFQWRYAWRVLVLLDPMADGATDAVASQRAILEVRIASVR